MQDWLAARASISPGKLALVAPFGGTRDFRRMDEVASKFAAYLLDRGLSRGDRVAILLENVHEFVSLVFAAMRLQLVIVPINTRLSAEEMRWQLENTECKCLISAHQNLRHLQEMTASLGIPVYCVNITVDVGSHVEHLRSISDKSILGSITPTEIDLDKPFAIIHTSGTSGNPKGVVLAYGNWFYSAMASAYRLGHDPHDRWLCTIPLYHVGGLSILMRAVLYGITVDLRPRFDVDQINIVLDSQPITIISLVPTMLYRLLESRTTWPNSLRLILLGGAGASPELIGRCRALNLPIATTYGLTEAASQVATALPEAVYRKSGSVGKPLMFSSLRIVNPDNKPIRPNELGEITVSGPTIMQGYFNDPQATAKTLQDNELQTSDIGYLDEDGDLFVVQRRSDLIVSGGENVYPAEVEQVLKQHPDIIDAVVIGLPDEEWGQQVAAAIILQQGSALNITAVQEFCRQSLASYKLPRQIRLVKQIPQTASGKVQRSAISDLFKDED